MGVTSEKQNVIDTLTALVEGKISPANWIVWWNQHLSSLEKELPRIAFLKIKPNVAFGETRATLISQTGAFDYLKKLDINVLRSEVYAEDWEQTTIALEEEKIKGNAVIQLRFAANFAGLQKHFPKLYKTLSKYLSDDDKVLPGVNEGHITAKEQAIDSHLSALQKEFFGHISALFIEGVKLDFNQIRNVKLDNQEYIFLGEYWLDGDGDTIWCKSNSADEAIYYLCHSAKQNRIKHLAASFEEFLEKTWSVLLKKITSKIVTRIRFRFIVLFVC